MKNTILEQVQINKKNKLDGLHPKAKLIILFLYIICTFIISTVKATSLDIPIYLMLWFLVVLLLFALSGKFMKCVKASRLVLTIFSIIMIAQSLLLKGGDVLFKLGFITIEQAGLAKACSLGFMVLDIAGIFVWFFQTTSHKEIAAFLNEAGVNEKVSYVFVSTLKMIDEMSKNSKTIMAAQRARGIETEGNLLTRAKAFVPSLVPLILTAITGAEERVMTLEARGFSVNGTKTSVYKLKKSGLETAAIILAVIITILVIVWRIFR